MTEVRATVEGMDELLDKFRRITSDVRPAMAKATEKAVLYVHGQVPDYPTPPPESLYRRTGTLGRTITTEVRSLGNDVAGVIGTATVYAPWVIGHEQLPDGRGPQARAHKGRWYRLLDVVTGATDKVLDIYREMIRDLLRG